MQMVIFISESCIVCSGNEKDVSDTRDASFIIGSLCPSISPPKAYRYDIVLSLADNVIRSGHCGRERVSFPFPL